MQSRSAQQVVPAPAEALYAWLLVVENWPQFMEGLDAVELRSFRRYRWTVRHGQRTTTVDVALSADPREKRLSWRRIKHSAFDGTLRLTSAGDGRTRVDLGLHLSPTDLVDGIPGVGERTAWDADRDLKNLADLVRAGQVVPAPESGRVRR